MKFSILLTSLLIIARLTQAQEYVPFPDSNAVWSVNTDKFYVSGDTVIEGLQYKKYFRTLEDSSLQVLNGTYYAALREDESKRIWAIKFDSIAPLLLYDFSVNVNDTITIYPLEDVFNNIPDSLEIVILDIDSV
ncbi:MAG: hypothetical protein HRT72_04120, partial [Flavobacteriales bacterium]|nr:hypothetical protein [Flavobacteriales bacterium]